MKPFWLSRRQLIELLSIEDQGGWSDRYKLFRYGIEGPLASDTLEQCKPSVQVVLNSQFVRPRKLSGLVRWYSDTRSESITWAASLQCVTILQFLPLFFSNLPSSTSQLITCKPHFVNHCQVSGLCFKRCVKSLRLPFLHIMHMPTSAPWYTCHTHATSSSYYSFEWQTKPSAKVQPEVELQPPWSNQSPLKLASIINLKMSFCFYIFFWILNMLSQYSKKNKTCFRLRHIPFLHF